ncbi:MAG: TldD/PmbA family protein [Faecousia sp.]
MDFNTFKDAVIARCQALGITEYELYYQAGDSTSVSAFQHGVDQFTCSTDGGVCFRCLVGGRMGYASTEELSAAQAAAIVDRAADNAATLESDEAEFLGEGGQDYEPLTLETKPMPTTEALISRVLATQEQLYAADPAVIDGSSTQGIAERSEFAIFNSKGLDLHYENTVSGLVVAAVVTNGTEMANDYQIKISDLDAIDTGVMTKKAAQGAKAKLGGDVAPTGVFPVVFDSEAMSDLLQTFCSIFSSEAAQKGLSRLGDKEGQVIASPVVTLVDDPFHKDNPMPINFDAEGSPTHCKKVIENGVLNTLLYNLKTAHAAGKKTTGNASKAGYDAPVAIRPFTMYLAPGALTEDALLEKAGTGVYIHSLGGLHAGANPITGDFSLQSEGFLIEGGKKTTHVKSFTVAGNFYDLLRQITAVASNMEVPTPMGMTAFGSPSVLVENLSIAGK